MNEWCESPVPYTTLALNEQSETVTLGEQETAYFRFFIPEELYCTPVQLLIRPFYGVPVFFLSNDYAVPGEQNAAWRKGLVPPYFGWAQNTFVICPSYPGYSVGTFSLGVFAWYTSSFFVEVVVASQKHPLLPPPDRITCNHVPEQDLIDAQAGSDSKVFCLNDTETLLLEDFTSGEYAQLAPSHHARFVEKMERERSSQRIKSPFFVFFVFRVFFSFRFFGFFFLRVFLICVKKVFSEELTPFFFLLFHSPVRMSSCLCHHHNFSRWC